MAVETKHTFCRICEALCGLEVTVDEGKITKIRPDNEHVATDGFSCAKGLKQFKMYDSPDRLKYPLKRVDGEFVRISWDQALEEIGAKVRQLRGDHHADAIAMYIGTAAGFGVLHPIFAQGLIHGLGSKSNYASATQDCSNKFAVAAEMYGFAFTQPFPDVDRVQCLITVGANPAISKWSFVQVSNPIKRLREIEGRGGKVFFVDPRKTESAKVAGTHFFIRPGTDVFFYLSFLHEVLERGSYDAAHVDTHMSGFDALKRVAAGWTPERTAEVTKLPAEALREMVDAYLEADGAALYCSTGVNMGGHGALAFWLQESINAITGNLDRRGGTVVGHGIMDFIKFGKRTGALDRKDRSRVGDFASVNDAFPGGVLADEILTPGEKQVRALFVTGGNPLMMMANSGRMREAFEKLELLVCLDIQRSETAQLAHYILPCVSPMQRPDLPFVFPLMLGMQSKPYMQATERVIEAEGEQRDEATIYLDLCRASGVNFFGSAIAQRLLEFATKRHSKKHPGRQRSVPQEGLLDLLLRLTRQPRFAKLLDSPHGDLRPEHSGGDFLGHRVVTEDGKVALAPPALIAATADLEVAFERERESEGTLKLITKRHVTTHNSWTHNIDDFVTGGGQNHLYVHPDDAERIGLAEGEMADVTSATATVRLPIKRLADLMPGTVALPHGWGHQVTGGLNVANKTEGVNVNLLAADGPESIDPLSGMAHLTGIPVEVRPAAGPKDGRSWSGIEETA